MPVGASPPRLPTGMAAGPGAADAPAASRPRAGRESIDADQRVSVNLAASGGRAVDRTDA